MLNISWEIWETWNVMWNKKSKFYNVIFIFKYYMWIVMSEIKHVEYYIFNVNVKYDIWNLICEQLNTPKGQTNPWPKAEALRIAGHTF